MVIVRGKFVGYQVEGYTSKRDGQHYETHLVRLADEWGQVNTVKVPAALVSSAAALRECEFGEDLEFVCVLTTGFLEYQRVPMLEMTAHVPAGSV